LSVTDDRIAIVGMACRFPGGVADEDGLWALLRSTRDAVGTLGDDRWSTEVWFHPRRAEPGRSVTLSAGLLERVDAFDAAFFGISPREARQMDPQQRLLLELTWEALENGGQPPDRLAGSDCAVYIGISSTDYGLRSMDDLSAIDAYSMTGNTLSIAANRISYLFDLRGPSMAVDTACSSALVALHQACRSLREGEASMAIAGGVSLLLHPYPFIGFSKASMLSARGRCRPFDAGGDGYVRSEGGGILFLKPLARALADADPIHAVILASGVNSDGARKTGITIPSAQGQAELLRATCARAGIEPTDIAYVEAHGTGTLVGDPIEAAALGEAIGRRRPADDPLPIGSVKSNLGHLESASGMAGLMKTILCLKHRAIPASLHLETPNPNIDFAALNLKVVNALQPLPSSDRPLRMGVNSFGFGGANAHVLLEEAPARAILPARDPQVTPPLFLSARGDAALAELAQRYLRHLETAPADAYYDICHAAAHRRQSLEDRLVIHGATREQVQTRLAAWCAGDTASPGAVRERALTPAGARLAFVYSGNGAQWLGMGRRLLEQSPVFRQTIEEIDAKLRALGADSLLDELHADTESSRLDRTEVAQPALFAVQVGITRILRAQGLDADAALGHSVGEVAAAWAVGALTLDQAVQVIHARSAAQAQTRGVGRMAALGLSAEQALAEIEAAGLTHEVELAAYNGPRSVTLSGTLSALQAIGERAARRRGYCRVLDLDYAFHSHHMEPIREPVLRDLADLRPARGSGRFISTVTGGELPGDALDAGYWWDNIRKPVRFEQAVGTLLADGYHVFLEIAPHAVLQHYLRECLEHGGSHVRALAALRRDDDGLERLMDALLRCHALGCPLDRTRLFPFPAYPVPLPGYPWQRERHWYSVTSEGYDLVNRRKDHPLLGYRLKDAEAAWENQIDVATLPYLADHVVGGAVVFPASGFVELALAAWRATHDAAVCEVRELEIRAPLVLDEQHARTLRCDFRPDTGEFSVRSRQRLSTDPWMPHCVARVAALAAPGGTTPATAAPPIPAGEGRIDADRHYATAQALGLEYGPAFRALATAWPAAPDVVAQLAVPEAIAADLARYILHPSLLDACFQTLVDLFHGELTAETRATLLPVQVGRLRLHQPGAAVAWCITRLVRQSPRSVLVDFRLCDARGGLVAQLDGCRFRGTSLGRPAHHHAAIWRYVARVQPRRSPDEAAPLPASRDMVRCAELTLLELREAQRRSDHFLVASPLFDALVGAFAYRAVAGLLADHPHWPRRIGDAPDGLAAEQQPLFLWLLDVLRQDGYLVEHGETWSLHADDIPPAPEDIWLTLLGDYAEYLPDLVQVGRVGRALPALLRGAQDATALVAALRASPLREQMIEASPTYAAMLGAVLAILRDVAQAWPANRRLRILEIGAVSPVLTRRLLETLPPGRRDYVAAFDDDDRLAQARMEFMGEADVECLRFEPTAGPPRNHPALAADFDIVLAHHSLHRAGDPAGACADILRLLCPGGMLLLLERHADRAADLARGVTPDWWLPRTPAPQSRLRAPRIWAQWLKQQGYGEVNIVEETDAADLASGVFLVLARRGQASALARAHAARSPDTWLLITDEEGAARTFAESLRARLLSRGQQVALAFPGKRTRALESSQFVVDTRSAEGMRALLELMRAGFGHCGHVVHLLGLTLADDAAGIDALEMPERRCVSALHLAQAIAAPAAGETPRLWLVTGAAAAVAAHAGSGYRERMIPSQAPLWGLGRVLMNEVPALGCTLVDLRTEALDGHAADLLLRELLEPDGEDEIVLDDDNRYVTRMHPAELAAPDGTLADAAQVKLDFDVPGQLRNLRWRPTPSRAPERDEIEIQPMAVGLNFRDVMYAMGLLSDEAVENGFAGATLGMELSGVVTRVGAEVRGYAPGDAVVAFAPACFSSRVLTRAQSVAPKPPVWSFEQAATVPTVFFTVYYALHHLTRLQPGERILIHGAAGGVGIAAIQMARYLGAEIFATAGNEDKRAFASLLGAHHVLNSRDLAFADEILALTGGEGVDVVLNSLAGEAMQRSLDVLRPFGRFLELGKRDFYENTRVGLRPFKDNISYFGIDADQLMARQPELAARLFREMMALFEQGALRPLPHRAFPAARVVDAFRYMQQARQIGKVVVTFGDGPPEAQRPPRVLPAPRLRPDACYLVTGGVGGFGLETACWLAEAGARELLLLSRRGAAHPEAASAQTRLAALGARAHIVACDIGDADALGTCLARAARELPPLRGIVHAAMVLDDGLVQNIDATRLRAVLAPKVAGAWNLHQATLSLPLDFFILYSSATTFVGNPGQANYVAANAYLEALALARRQQGLPATCVSWGAIEDAGYLARNRDVKAALQSRLGGAALDTRHALARLGDLLARDESGVAVMDFDWGALRRLLPAARAPRFAEAQQGEYGGTANEQDVPDIRTLIANRTEQEVIELVRGLVTDEIAQILRLPAERIDTERSLYDLGMDSLMGVELMLGIEKRFGIQLPMLALSEGPTIRRISERLAHTLLAGTDAAMDGDEDAALKQVVADMAVQHAQEASEDDVEHAVREIRAQRARRPQ
jgi:acyl transferase domain-containing protein/NADPH:quinone reductase-like Zn-dependent oxidoreductase/acyl carrier protein/NADP-dependent 3-hydroxy acid dehydrogenase YdfG